MANKVLGGLSSLQPTANIPKKSNGRNHQMKKTEKQFLKIPYKTVAQGHPQAG